MTESLDNILAQIKKNNKPHFIFPQFILEQLGYERRSWRVVETFNSLLEHYDLYTEIDFGSVYFYNEFEIKPKKKVSANSVVEIDSNKFDPTPRLSILKAANITKIKDDDSVIGLISVNRENTIEEATTLMIRYSFSQLPILSGRSGVDGIISWKSIGRTLALGIECKKVFDCKEDVTILSLEEPLFKAVKTILEKEVVLVKEKDNSICGIITATDIGDQFIQLSEPFLLIEQIENHLRKLLHNKLTFEEIKSVVSEETLEKPFNHLSNLSFGHYVRIIENAKLFEKLEIKVDRVIFRKLLEDVRLIRNFVMHFRPEPFEGKDLEILRQAVNFLQILNNTMVRQK